MNRLTMSISTPTYDLLGSVMLHNIEARDSDMYSLVRRSVRTPTLNGGSYLDDLGYTDEDRTLEVVLANGTDEQRESLEYMIRAYSELNIMLPDGAYIGNLQQLSDAGGKLRLTVLITGTQ